MNFQNITVAGSGVLGYQIAFQTAFHGFNVTVYDINDEALEKAKAKFDILSEAYRTDLKATPEQLDAAFKNLQYTANLAEAVKNADLLIEAVPESPQIKIDFYEKLRSVAPEKNNFRDQFFYDATKSVCRKHRPAGEISGTAFCQRNMETQYRRNYGDTRVQIKMYSTMLSLSQKP